MKAYTDLEQSKKLAEILPIETADMRFCFSHTLGGRITGHYPMIGREPSMGTIPCWSLAALIDVLPAIKGGKPIIVLDDNYITYPLINDLHTKSDNDNLIDATYDMIIRLNELNLL